MCIYQAHYSLSLISFLTSSVTLARQCIGKTYYSTIFCNTKEIFGGKNQVSRYIFLKHVVVYKTTKSYWLSEYIASEASSGTTSEEASDDHCLHDSRTDRGMRVHTSHSSLSFHAQTRQKFLRQA